MHIAKAGAGETGGFPAGKPGVFQTDGSRFQKLQTGKAGRAQRKTA